MKTHTEGKVWYIGIHDTVITKQFIDKIRWYSVGIICKIVKFYAVWQALSQETFPKPKLQYNISTFKGNILRLVPCFQC